MIPSCFHLHTAFCDGENTPEELVKEAIRLGCPAIGFSGHSFTPFDTRYCMSKDGTKQYQSEIKALKIKYRDSIKIYLGIEQDYFSDAATGDYDYVIGSVHYVKKDGAYLPVDESPENLAEAVAQHYNGDYYALAEDYYALVGDVVQKTDCDLIGHFDLITKFNEKQDLFRTDDPRYRRAVLNALDRLLATGRTFEINTGAISRGWRTQPYPEKWILDSLTQAGAKTYKTSDAHKKENLLFGL